MEDNPDGELATQQGLAEPEPVVVTVPYSEPVDPVMSCGHFVGGVVESVKVMS